MVKVNAVMQAELISLLMKGVYSCKELADLSGAHYKTVLSYCKELHKRKVIHINMWINDGQGRELVRIYKLGERADAVRKKPTAAERQRKYRERKRLREQN
jgi:hypothetical protein